MAGDFPGGDPQGDGQPHPLEAPLRGGRDRPAAYRKINRLYTLALAVSAYCERQLATLPIRRFYIRLRLAGPCPPHLGLDRVAVPISTRWPAGCEAFSLDNSVGA
jgi:hypothetical protein